MPRLGTDDFARFFEAVHGVAPFPWQARLARQVFERGWPKALDVPTGAGKTAAIDVAVFHLALEAGRGGERSAPVRIAFVVDRRLVVDEAFERASRISAALEAATEGPLFRVKERLRLLSEPGRPVLATVKLRGGAPREPDWVRTPSQPAVIVSTVDQVGSRVLFRGYGVSDAMRPVHAGLLGCDALYLLDEAHLSQPFLQTLCDSRRFQRETPWCDDAVPAPFGVVSLSATQSEESVELVMTDDRRHPVLGRRLAAQKPVELVEISDEPGDPGWVGSFVSRVWSLSTLGGGAAETAAVVVNGVKRARAVYEALVAKIGDPARGDVALLIGPARPLERDERIRALLPRMSARRGEGGSDRTLIVVATQCIEAGADLDFDAMVTEVAPIDSLRQRFGRLNRTGRRVDARGVILASVEQVGKRAAPDPIYGTSAAATWHFLTSRARAHVKGKERGTWIDFGIEASQEWLPAKAKMAPLLAPRADAPVIMPAFVEQWAVTSPPPAADPDVSLFLHGPRAGPADVQIVWRVDVTESALEEALRSDGARRRLALRMEHCPPSTLESVAVPLAAARRWLQAETAEVADVEVSPAEAGGADRRGGPDVAAAVRMRAFRWRGGDHPETRVVRPREIEPGDVLVVPAAYGGCDAWGWAPHSGAGVRDVAREANRRHRGRDVLRLVPEVVAQAWQDEQPAEESGRWRGRLADWLTEMRDARDAEVRAALAAAMEIFPPSWCEAAAGGGGRVERDEDGTPLAVVFPMKRAEGGGEPATEDDRGSRAACAVTLERHSAGVREEARSFSERLGLPREVAADVALAAFLHDAGKAHPQFKRWLHDGDELAALAGIDLAKSGRRLGPEARARAGLPAGARHELASLSYATAHPAFAEAHDPDLVLWLIGTHHGFGRPFFPLVQWPSTGSTFVTGLGAGAVTSEPARTLAALTSSWCDLMARLTRRYGPWGLARLEAIVRLADHRRSEREQEAT